MATIGVLLVEADRGILSSIVRDVLATAPQVEVRGELPAIRATSDAIERTGSDAVVWISSDARGSVAPAELLNRHPTLRVLVVERSGRNGFVWRMRPSRRANLISALGADP